MPRGVRFLGTRSHETTQSTRFDYDALGRRIGKTDAFGRTDFIWEGLRLIEERRGAHASAYLYEPGSYVPLARIDAAATSPRQADWATRRTGQRRPTMPRKASPQRDDRSLILHDCDRAVRPAAARPMVALDGRGLSGVGHRSGCHSADAHGGQPVSAGTACAACVRPERCAFGAAAPRSRVRNLFVRSSHHE